MILVGCVIADVITVAITMPITKAKKKKMAKQEKDSISNNKTMVNVGEIANIEDYRIGFFEDGVNLPDGNRVIIDYPIEYKEGISFVIGEKY